MGPPLSLVVVIQLKSPSHQDGDIPYPVLFSPPPLLIGFAGPLVGRQFSGVLKGDFFSQVVPAPSLSPDEIP